MAIVIRNNVRSPLTFNLTTKRKRRRVNRFEYDPNTGQRHTRRVWLDIPDSLTVLARDKTKPLPSSYRDEPEIVAAKARGDITIHEVPDSKPPEKQDSKAPTRRRSTRVSRSASSLKPETETTSTGNSETESEG